MTSKPYTIPTEYERQATLSAWLRTYGFMRKNPRAWGLHKAPVTSRCKAMYPEIVAMLHAESRPQIINLPVSSSVAIAA